jgi:hypothetical protein
MKKMKKKNKKRSSRPVRVFYSFHFDDVDISALSDQKVSVFQVKHHGTSWSQDSEAAAVMDEYLKASMREPPAGQPRLVLAPGTHAERALRWLFSRATFDLSFNPSITDMRWEYFESLDRGEHLRASFRYCVWWFTLLKIFAKQIGWSLIAKLINLWKLGS